MSPSSSGKGEGTLYKTWLAVALWEGILTLAGIRMTCQDIKKIKLFLELLTMILFMLEIPKLLTSRVTARHTSSLDFKEKYSMDKACCMQYVLE